MVVSDALPGYFDQFGWRYDRRHPSEFLTGFSGDNGAWDIWVRVTDLVVSFSISPYVPRPDDAPAGAPLFLAMLKANHELNLAKLGIDTDGDICLSVEMPADDFAYSQFADALMALAHYADEFKARLDDAVAADAEDLAARQGML